MPVNALDFIGIISEILTLVGLIIGTTLYIVGLSVRGISGRWTRTSAVIAASGAATVIRWFDDLGDVHECPADTHDKAAGAVVLHHMIQGVHALCARASRIAVRVASRLSEALACTS